MFSEQDDPTTFAVAQGRRIHAEHGSGFTDRPASGSARGPKLIGNGRWFWEGFVILPPVEQLRAGRDRARARHRRVDRPAAFAPTPGTHGAVTALESEIPHEEQLQIST